jgi:hypothetical protein
MWKQLWRLRGRFVRRVHSVIEQQRRGWGLRQHFGQHQQELERGIERRRRQELGRELDRHGRKRRNQNIV